MTNTLGILLTASLGLATLVSCGGDDTEPNGRELEEMPDAATSDDDSQTDDPVEQTDDAPTDPSDPGPSGDPTDPTDPVSTDTPAIPVDPTDPSDPTQPGDPIDGGGEIPVDPLPDTDAGSPITIDSGVVEPPNGVCGSSAECSQPTPYCETTQGVCVECLGSPNCNDPALPACDEMSNTCVECVGNADCGAGAPACDTATNSCVECLADTDCDMGLACDTNAMRCVPTCESDADCAAPLAFCDTSAAICVECLADDQCAGQFDACVAGSCECAGDLQLCANECRDLQSDPDHCGGCGTRCDDDEMCTAGSCECRSGLVACGEQCVDVASNASNCGECGVVCGDNEMCLDGGCQPSDMGCGDGLEECGGGRQGGTSCVDTGNDPLHCGGCGDSCDRDEVCVEGNCQQYEPALACNQCPCADACDVLVDQGACCDIGGVAMCVEDGVCPQ